MTTIEQRKSVFVAAAFVTLASCATGVPPSEDRPRDDGGTSGGAGGSPAAGGAGGTSVTGGTSAVAGAGGSTGSGGSPTSSGGTGGDTGGVSGDAGLDAAAGTGGSGGTGGMGGAGGRSGITDGGGDIRNCNPGKTNDCPTPISACEMTGGCVDIVLCIMQNGCSRTPCSGCTALIQAESESARMAAENLFACLGGCS